MTDATPNAVLAVATPTPYASAISVNHSDPNDTSSLKTPSTSDHAEIPYKPYKGRWWMLALFSLANFIDIYAASGTVLAIPDLSRHLNLTIPQSIWVISSYALAFAAMMLSAGRVADIWNAKYVFIIGLVWIGAFSIGLALIDSADGMIVLRALQGVGAAMTIPAATNLIVNIFPEPALQEIAIAIFGATGALANVLGLVFGGLLLLAGYEWIFYFIPIITFPAAILAFLFVPNLRKAVAEDTEAQRVAQAVRKPKMDYLGTLTMTAAIVLFIYGLTSANVDGWKSAGSIATIIIGFFMFGVFYYIETLPKNPDDALIPPSMWKIPNFTLLAGMAVVVPFWYFAVQSSLSERMQHQGASPLLVAARLLPMGFATLFAVAVLQNVPLTVIPLRWRLFGGGFLAAIGALMISFAKETISYWALLFPAFIIGAMGAGTLFLTLNVAIVMSVGPERAGVAGAVLNTLFQLGIAIGLAITTVLQVSYRGSAEALEWKGYRYSFLFVMAVELAAGILGLVLFKDPMDPQVAAEIEEKSQESAVPA